MNHLLIVLIFLLLLAPGRPGWFDGLPLSQLHEMTALVLLGAGWIFLPLKGRFSKTWLLIVIGLLIVLKVYLGQISLPQGLQGSYYYPSLQGERLAQRLDREINFLMLGYSFNNQPFPVWFFNDKTRFNDIRVEERARLPLAVVWDGYLYLPAGQNILPVNIEGEASVNLDNQLIFQEKDFAKEVVLDYQEETVLLPIKINYQAEPESGKSITVSGRFFPDKFSLKQIAADARIGFLYFFIQLIAGVFILSGLWFVFDLRQLKKWLATERPYLFIIFLIIFFSLIRGLLQAAQASYFSFLPEGNDPLTYETYARHLLTGRDWLMQDFEEKIYYHQILYYHFLALIHYLFGEAIFPIVFLQLAAVLGTALLLVYLYKLLIKPKAEWHYGLMMPLLFIVASSPIFTGQAFHLFPGGALLLTAAAVALLAGRRPFHFFLAGIIFGLAVLMRTNFLSLLLLIILWFLGDFINFRKKLISLPFYIFGVVLPLTPFIIRNKLLSGYWTLISNSNSTINFIKATPLPEGYFPAEDRFELLKSPNLFFDVRAIPHLSWIIENPLDYFSLIWEKFLFYIGYNQGWLIGLWIFLPFILFVISSVLFLWRPAVFSPAAQRRHYLITGGFVWLQLLTIIIFSDIHRRLMLPILPIILLLAVLLLIPISRKLDFLNK